MLIMVKSKNDEGGEKINLAPLFTFDFIESKVGVEVILKDFLEIALDIYMVK